MLRSLHRYAAALLACCAPLLSLAQAAATDCPPQAPPLTPEQVEAGMRAAEDHGFLWRVTRDGRTSYLYGTIHVARLEWVFPGPTVVDALRESDTVALELDVLDAEVQRRLQLAMSADRGLALPAAVVDRVRRRAALECVSPDALAKMAPEMQVASLTVLAARRDGLDPAYSVDLMLSGVAHGARKTVISLETPEAQMKALQMPSADDAVAFMTDALDDLESGRVRPLLNRLAAIWAAGDHAQLSRYGEWCDCRRTPAEQLAMKRLVDDRNPAMADAIDALHRNGRRVFAAVGSLHMIGPRGLPALLAARGYTVERGDFEAEPEAQPPKAQ
jgi:uncharacterized protein YbaP (TraB family)